MPTLLGRLFPGLDGQAGSALPLYPLATLPTPLVAAPELGAAIGAPGLLVKDDGLAGDPYGGNKVRKLEYLLGDALRLGCDTVLTFGAAGSNHVLASAIHARAAGLGCHGVLVHQPPSPAVARALLWHARLGTLLATAAGFADADATAVRLQQSHPGGAARLYIIPWGGSSPLGCAGFVAAGLELAGQLAGLDLPSRPRIYLPCGTMGSVAGLLVGLRLARCPATVVAVKVVPQPQVDAAAVEALSHAVCAALHARYPGFPERIEGPVALEFRAGFLGDGYALATPEGLAAGALARELAGVSLEQTYSAKALACLIADVRRPRPPDGTPVFWVTCNGRPGPADLSDAPVHRLPAALRRYLD